MHEVNWSPAASDKFMRCLVVAVHCVRHHFQCLSVDKKDTGDTVLMLCADNCPGHFEITLREPLRPEDETPEAFYAHIATMIESVHRGGNRMNFYLDGMELLTPEASYLITNHQA
jgi:hypothetical protein